MVKLLVIINYIIFEIAWLSHKNLAKTWLIYQLLNAEKIELYNNDWVIIPDEDSSIHGSWDRFQLL